MPDSIQTLLAIAVQTLKPTSDTALLDAEVLLCFCLGKDRAYLRTWPERQINEEHSKQYLELVAQRRKGIPVAYLTGSERILVAKLQSHLQSIDTATGNRIINRIGIIIC